MHALDLLRHEVRSSYGWLEAIVLDVSEEQARWRPPGTANSIASNYAHTMMWADIDLNRHFHNRAPLIAGEWGDRLGTNDSNPDEWAAGAEVDWHVLREYGRAVHRSVQELVESLTEAELERRFQMIPAHLGAWKGIDVYTLHVGRHVWMHGGEIACRKGLKGVTRYGRFMSLYQ